MEITINTPALLFPAISLIMLAYTNRFLALASRVRSLHERYRGGEASPRLHAQIVNIRDRLRLIKKMQFLGVMAFLIDILCMWLIYIGNTDWASSAFAVSMSLFAASLVLSLLEINKSNHSVELELSDIDDKYNAEE